ncbi:ABC transporter ATP-binding protein [Janibacter sp. YIM B02568]|uniref:ABC transporter ATP-binding protein n=1 Tax=Janibacter endophyticus TaxID=2806261 RepID=UPI001951368F|nr:ABC transporter ATP-binding protein [Janibacter endophyticus]MBM6545358.1 ABC transporter ATP-binding protein [Janibacter endophyticus]
MTRPLSLEDVTLQFGGVRALDDLSFTVEPGTIHAVIGPNGAGKSSTFNVISGHYRPSAGRVTFGDVDLTAMAPHSIADEGIGRAFQNIAISGHASVLDNLMVARHRLTKAGFITTALGLPQVRAEERRHRVRVTEIADFVGLGDHLHSEAGTLSYGDRKRLEIARALASEPEVVLLDEPAAGMPPFEKWDIAALVMSAREHLGISVLIVEHDMPVVMAIADHITVLDFGRGIAHGTPEEIRNDPAVIAAYLGHQPSNEQAAAAQELLDEPSRAPADAPASTTEEQPL